MSKATSTSSVCSLTLRTPHGREQTMAALIPNEQVRRHYISKAHKAGLGIEIKNLND